MSNTYNLIQCGQWGTAGGCIETPFYKLNSQPGNMIVPTADNRTYMHYAMKPGYRGFYDDNCIQNPLGGTKACDLTYVNAPLAIHDHCWDVCQTDACHNSCVVSKTK